MRNYRNNFRRNRFKNHSDRNNLQNDNGVKLINNIQNGSSFIRKNVGRNNHNAPKLIEKYTSLAREALLVGDKILSENYFQHAEHFIRILGEKDNLLNKNKISNETANVKEEDKKNINNLEESITTEN
jgi:hypothetical protein|tara:strand:+ start:703 stop:1086 length:384 start_codon:yes stop_codon:yes gene_type:complete